VSAATYTDLILIMLLFCLIAGLQAASMDAEAIQAATAVLMSSSSSRVAKKLFVVTDGYGTSGLALANALSEADQAGIEVVGISVGFDRSHVPLSGFGWGLAVARFP
jgi:hypothetical protein